MKIRSLFLGSAAVLGLSTAGFAADLGVVTSLDVCDELGLSGLTISSDDNCLVITGGVDYSFSWGDYADGNSWGPKTTSVGDDGANWNSELTAWLQFAASASSDFGPAVATIKLKSDTTGEGHTGGFDGSNTTSSPEYSILLDKAWVQVGDTTVLMAGLKSSIANFDDDTPFNYAGLFNSESVSTGVGFDNGFQTGGEVIQVVSNLGNGVSIGGGLEDLNGGWGPDGTAVGVLSYAGDTVTGHVTMLYDDILDDGANSHWGVHAGVTATMDQFKIRAAIAAEDAYWNGLASVEATFDMFKLAASVEGTSDDELGVGASASATVSDGITINGGFRWFDWDTTNANTETMEARAQLVAAVTETITLTGTVGWYSENAGPDDMFYGEIGAAWAPGGGFTSSVNLYANSDSAYKVTFKAGKTIK